MRRLVLAAAALSLLALPVPGRAATSPCRVDLEQRNQWHAVASAGALAMDDTDPCRVLGIDGSGVYASDDGGQTRSRVGTAPTDAERLIAGNLPRDHAALLGKDGSVWTTADRGRRWTAASGLKGPVRALVTDESDADRMFAVLSSGGAALPVALPVAASSTLEVSTDGGHSFATVAGATGLAVTAVAPDAGVPSRWWIGVSGPAGGLYVSEDAGGTFTEADSGGRLSRTPGSEITDLDTSRLAGGGGEVVAATSDGILISRDDGQTVVQHLAGTAFTGLALEYRHPSAALLLAGDVRRTSDVAAHQRAFSDGLPKDCGPSQLRHDHSTPSVFLVQCSDGSTWRMRSDGTDLSAADLVDGDQSSVVPPRSLPPATPMRQLRALRLPLPGSRGDGSIAFDGSVLYYGDLAARGLVHRIRASDGKELPDVVTEMGKAVFQLAYDANRDHLLIIDVDQVVWDVDVSSGRTQKLFTMSGFEGPMTFDNASGHLLFAADGSNQFTEYNLAGRQVGGCPSQLGTDGLAFGPSMAGMVATGDGLIYAEDEDDSTVWRLDRSCHALARFSHETFSEASNENDALACDTTTFDEPAVWLRDASAARVIAYAVQSGYCALPSTVSVSAPPSVRTGQAGPVCARLITAAKRQPLPGQRIDLLVAGRGIGSPLTDRTGRACAAYHPLDSEAGAGSATSKALQPVLAAFLGTPAYRPASARASLVVSRAVVVPAPPAVEAQPAAAPVLVAPPPPPPVQPPQPPPPAPQQQPVTQPQGHPGAQPGAMGQLGAAAMPEDEAEAAAQGADTHLMTRVDWEAYALPSSFGVLAFAAVLRRRRASRVRGQSA